MLSPSLFHFMDSSASSASTKCMDSSQYQYQVNHVSPRDSTRASILVIRYKVYPDSLGATMNLASCTAFYSLLQFQQFECISIWFGPITHMFRLQICLKRTNKSSGKMHTCFFLHSYKHIDFPLKFGRYVTNLNCAPPPTSPKCR